MEKMQNLKRIRKERRLTREELSKISGVNKTTIQRLEEGMYNVEMVKLGTLVKLATALKCKIKDLLDETLQKKIA